MLTFMAALVTEIQAEMNVPGAVSEHQRAYLGTNKVGISLAACCVRAQAFK